MYILPPSISKKIEGYRWQSFTPPAAGKSRRFRGLICHRRSQTARETIYPAATRHREGLDIYVNRTPLAFDIADRRPEDQAERPVTDSDIREHLAERWSRSQPKEAALDYVLDGAWREHQDDPRRHVGRSGGGQQETPEARAAANDNAFARIADEIRHAVIGWRHGAAVDAFAAERSEVLAAWGELRERTRAEGGTVALSPTFRETLDRHAALLKRASSFRTRPRTYERLLGERAGIGKQDLDEFEALHTRAGKYRRVVMLKTARTLREENARKQDEGRVHTLPSEQPVVVETMPRTTPSTAVMQPDTPAQAQPDSAEAPRQDAREAYEALNRDWDRHLARADRAGIHAIYVDGCEQFRARMEALADNPDLALALQGKVSRVLAIIDEETVLRREVEDYLAAIEGKIAYRENVLEVVSVDLRNEVADHHGYGEWRAEIEGLVETGQRILADRDAYGDHLKGIPAGGERIEWALEEIRETLARDDKHLAESRERERKRRAGREAEPDREAVPQDYQAEGQAPVPELWPPHVGAGIALLSTPTRQYRHSPREISSNEDIRKCSRSETFSSCRRSAIYTRCRCSTTFGKCYADPNPSRPRLGHLRQTPQAQADPNRPRPPSVRTAAQ